MQLFARLKTYCLARRNTDLRACAGIAANARLARPDVEDTEASQLNALALRQRVLQGLENRIDSCLGLIALKTGALNHLMNNVLLYQGLPPSGELSGMVLMLETFSAIVNSQPLP